jgi:hypothetical protein
MIMKRTLFKIAATEAEFHLENTLLNGQCFNWWKVESQKFQGVYKSYLVELTRESDDFVLVNVQP